MPDCEGFRKASGWAFQHQVRTVFEGIFRDARNARRNSDAHCLGICKGTRAYADAAIRDDDPVDLRAFKSLFLDRLDRRRQGEEGRFCDCGSPLI